MMATRTRPVGKTTLFFLVALGVWLGTPWTAQALELKTGDIVVTDMPDDRLVRIDPATGEKEDIPVNTPIFAPVDVAISPYGNLYVLGNYSPDAVYRVDPRTGERVTIHEEVPLSSPEQIVFDANGDLIITDGGAGSVFRLDLVGGGITAVSSGGGFTWVMGVAVAANGDLFVTDAGSGAECVWRVDPTAGEQTIVASGGSLDLPVGIAIEATGDLIVADSDSKAIIRIDPDAYDPGTPGSNQSIISSGVNFVDPRDVAIEADGNIVVVDPDARKVIRVDPVSGSQSVIWSDSNYVGLLGLGIAGSLPICPGNPFCDEEPLPNPALGSSDEIDPEHPDILAKAQELGTPLAIFKYVRNEIEYEVYYGSKNGALGTLWSGSGNDFDQASLVIALLRAIGVPARYAVGVVEVDADQLMQWAGVRDAATAGRMFEFHFCLNNPSLGPCAASPKRFELLPSQAAPTSARMEHAWVEAQLPARYRGLSVESGDVPLAWMPLDPSWKQKDYREPISLPIGNEVIPGGCGANDLCFDYDAYYAGVDPRLASEIWEDQVQAWLGSQPEGVVPAGATPDDVAYDGPIIPYEGEVLPVSLPFVPEPSPAVVAVNDLGEIGDGIARRFRLTVATCDGSCSTSREDLATVSFARLAGHRLTFTFFPHPLFGADVAWLEFGGPFGSWPNGATSILEYCAGVGGSDDRCWVYYKLLLDAGTLAFEPGVGRRIGADLPPLLQVRRDLIPGYSPTDLEGFVPGMGPDAEAIYPLEFVDHVAVGIDANQYGATSVQQRKSALLEYAGGLPLVDEGEEDLNSNGIFGEVLLDQGAPGISSCPDYGSGYGSCDIALGAKWGRFTDELLGELLHIATLRYIQRQREEWDRVLGLDGYVGSYLPNVAIAKAGRSYTYLFNQPVGVEPGAPIFDMRRVESPPVDIDGEPDAGHERLRREGRLMTHIGSSLEHQVWEELIGSEFVSTVKGIQLVRERYPDQELQVFTHADPGRVETVLGGFGFDTVSQTTREELTNILNTTPGGSERTIFSPIAAVSGEDDVEVFIHEEVTSTVVSFFMGVAVGGQLLGGSCELYGGCVGLFGDLLEDYDLAEALAYRDSLEGFGFVDIDSKFLTLDDGLGLGGFLAGDPVSMVSGNLHHTEEDLRLPTDGPPFEFVRTYNSQVSDAGALGVGWTHSYEMRVEPARDVREFTYLPSAMSGFDYGGEVYGARSDTLDTKNPGGSGTETISWEGLPSAFSGRVEVESMTLEIAYEGGLTVDPGTGQAAVNLTGSVGEPRFEAIELETAGGAPYQSLGPLTATLTNLDTSESIFFARLRIRYRGPAVERVALEPAAGGFAGWTDGGAALQDDDPSTCAPPTGEQATILFESQTPAELFGYELKLAVQRMQDGSAGSPESIVYRGTDTGEMFRTGPNHDDGARQRFMTTDLDAHGFLVTFDQDGLDEDPERQHQLCHLEYQALTLPEQREFVRADGARDRFTKSGTQWNPAPGVRSQLEELAAPEVGYRITEPDGRVLTFTQAGAGGAFYLTEIADPQGRALELTYDGSSRLEQVIWANSPQPAGSKEALHFYYDANDKLDYVEDWTLRRWDYTVDAAGDLREVRDPIEAEKGWTGTRYDYVSGETNEALNHNLERVTFPKDADATPGGDHWVAFEYYNSDQVAAHVDSLGHRQSFTFNIPRQETSTTDARGFTTIYRHDRHGNLVQRMDPDGAIWSWTYDESRNVTSETDPFGRTRSFTGHDARGNPAEIVDRDGKSTSFTYDSVSGAPETITDKRGHVRTVQFSSDGLPEEIRATLGGDTPLLVENLYDSSSRRLDRTLEPLGDGTGRQALTIYTYVLNSGNRDVERIDYWEDDGDGIEGGPDDRLLSSVEYQYDLLGRRTHETVHRTKAPDDASLVEVTTQTVYTKRDEIERVIRPDGTALVSQYDRNGNLELRYLEETLPDDSTVEHQRRELRYDALDRLVEVEDARHGITRFAYDAVGNRIAMTDPEGNTTRVEYDAMNRPVRVIDPNGAVTTTEYDAAGRVVAVIDATGVATRRSYDEVGRLVSLQQGESQAATREVFYDDPSPGDYYEELTDPNGNLTTFEFDDLGRVFRTTDATPQAGVTQLDYDLRGNLTRFVDPEGAETLFRFDALGRAEQTQRPYALGPHVAAYDELGNPIRIIKPDGCVLEQTYDGMSRLVRRRSTAACPAEVGAVDDRFGYDARGNLVAAQNARVGLLREYDSLGRLVREIDDRFGTAVAYLYDDASRMTSKLYPNGSLVQISYDDAGRPIGITDRFGDTTRYVYDPAGRRIQTKGTKTGITTNLAYDANGRLASIESLRADQSVASHFTYPAYDEAGNRTQMEVLAGAGQTLGTTDYVYDALHRLVEETRPGESTTHFAYDRAGNRTRSGSKSGSTWVAPYRDYAYDNAGTVTHRLLAITDDGGTPLHTFSAYDANGNPTEWDDGGGVRTLQWDALDRLVGISGAFQASYAYDPFGRRIEKTEAGTTTQYQYDGLDIVAEYDGASALLATYIFGPGIDEPIKVERGATVAAYHTDGLGSVVAISDAEAPAGADLATYEYDAFGNVQATSGSLPNAYTYTGRELDQSGLYYYRARYYLPPAGRFLTPDRIGLRGGANPYVYVSSNPVNFRDPFGLEAFSGFLNVAAPSSTLVADFGGLAWGTAPGFREFLWDVKAGLRGGGIGGGLVAASEFFEDRANFFRISADEALAEGDAYLWDAYAAQSRRNRFAAMMLRPTSIASLLAGGVGPGMLRSTATRGVSLSGSRAEIAALLSARIRQLGGFAHEGLPLIVDESVGVAGGPNAAAAALREAGFNARSVLEIFGRGGVRDPQIRTFAEAIGGRVVTFDKGATLGQGFGNLAIRPKGQLRDPASVVRFVQEMLP